MVLLKRMAMVVMMSCLSETAIAQQTPPTAAPSSHTEPWWNSKYGEADTIGALKYGDPMTSAIKLLRCRQTGWTRANNSHFFTSS